MAKQATPGQIGYTAYGDKADWKNFQGNPMPAWDQLSEGIQASWEAAAEAIVMMAGESVALDARDQLQIQHAVHYAQHFNKAGASGHGQFLMIAKLAHALRLDV